MQAASYGISRVLLTIIMLILCGAFVALVWRDENKHGVNNSNRAAYYRKNRNERKW